jgi:choline dehydrogenase
MYTSIKTYLAFAIFFAPAFSSPNASPPFHKLHSSSFGTPFNATYDFLIIGGGTSGLVLANRLSSSSISPSHTVAIIEAGSFYELNNGNVSLIPRSVWSGANTDFSDVNPLVDWEFMTEPEQGVGGQKMHYPRGKCLGGSSARNHMIYQRPSRGSMDLWAQEVGDERYGWEEFEKYFDKGVRFNEVDGTKRWANSTPAMDPAGLRASAGPLNLSYANYVLPFTSWAIKAMESMGLKKLAGYIDGELIGAAWHVQTTDPKTMIRDSAETAYLKPVLGRDNLVVYHSTIALKVLFEGNEAVGVECSTAGKEFTLKARKEVILSAGALQSPQLLMVSGIGSKETLEKFGIAVLIDAPGVGQGLEVCSIRYDSARTTFLSSLGSSRHRHNHQGSRPKLYSPRFSRQECRCSFFISRECHWAPDKYRNRCLRLGEDTGSPPLQHNLVIPQYHSNGLARYRVHE